MAIVESAEAGLRAAAGGATVIQLRAPNHPAATIEREAMILAAQSPVPVIISSRVDIALAARLAGVNLPANDISVADARRLLGDRWVSRSIHSREEAGDADVEGADFLLFGPIWSTATHPGFEPRGLAELRRLAAESSIPVLAIGGVTKQRIPDVESVCAGYASISLFT